MRGEGGKRGGEGVRIRGVGGKGVGVRGVRGEGEKDRGRVGGELFYHLLVIQRDVGCFVVYAVLIARYHGVSPSGARTW